MHHGQDRRPPPARLAEHAAAAEPARGARVGADSATGRVLAQDDGVCRPRLPGGRRLHGPRQLGDRHRRRRALRLHAAQRHHDLQPDGDPAAGAVRTARHRQRTRPGPGLPRQLLAQDHHPALAAVRNRHRRLRPRRSRRRGHRAQPAVRPAADLGRLPHGARRADRALSAEPRVPLRGSAGRRPHSRHRRIVRRRTVARASRTSARWRSASFRAPRSSPTARCSTSPSASSARR